MDRRNLLKGLAGAALSVPLIVQNPVVYSGASRIVDGSLPVGGSVGGGLKSEPTIAEKLGVDPEVASGKLILASEIPAKTTMVLTGTMLKISLDAHYSSFPSTPPVQTMVSIQGYIDNKVTTSFGNGSLGEVWDMYVAGSLNARPARIYVEWD